MKKNMAGLILVLFAIALFMTGCEKKAQEKEEAQEAVSYTHLPIILQPLSRCRLPAC